MLECKEMIKCAFPYSGYLLGETENRLWKSPQAVVAVEVEVEVVILQVECGNTASAVSHCIVYICII